MATNRTYYCTCLITHKDRSNRGRLEQRHLKFHPTEVNEEEICVHCGHYAWELPKHRLFPRSSLVPWRDEVAAKDSQLWYGIPEGKYYYDKNYYSDYEVDNGDAFDFNELIKDNDLQQELSQLYVRWGGNNCE